MSSLTKMPKRIYIKRAAYHLTTNCKNRFPFFEEDIFCNIFIDCIANAQKLKSFELIGFKINPDHSHIILQPRGDYNISQIMQRIKRVSSTHINQLIHFQRSDNPYKNLEWNDRLKQYNRMFIRKNNYNGVHEFPMFKWQERFDDQLIRDYKQLQENIFYLQKQAKKHDLKENKFLFVADQIPDNIVFIGDKKI